MSIHLFKSHDSNCSQSVGSSNMAVLSISNDQPCSKTFSRPGKSKVVPDSQIDGFGQANRQWGQFSPLRTSNSTVGSRDNFNNEGIRYPRAWTSFRDARIVRPCGRRGRVEVFQHQHRLNLGGEGRLVRRPWLGHSVSEQWIDGLEPFERRSSCLLASLGVRPVVLDCRRRVFRVELRQREVKGRREDGVGWEKWQW
jgi:hypothetical protein